MTIFYRQGTGWTGYLPQLNSRKYYINTLLPLLLCQLINIGKYPVHPGNPVRINTKKSHFHKG